MFGFRLSKLGAAVRSGTGSSGSTPLFSRPFSTTASLGASPTFARGSNATFIDHEDVVRTVPNNCARFEGARYVRNTISNSENFLAAPWLARATNITIVGGYADPNGGTNAYRCTATGASGRTTANDWSNPGTGTAVVTSLWVRRVTGTGDVALYDSLTGASTTSILTGITSEWKRFSVGKTIIDGTSRFPGFIINNSGDVIEVFGFQIQDKTGASDPTVPDDYVSVGVESAPYHGAGVDGARFFLTDNSGNSVDGSGVVTEATGATISPAPYQLVEINSATNRLINSSTPATQTTASLATGDYILWVEGAGSAAVTAGTATITGGGTASDGTPDLFTVTGAGTVTVTVTGSLDRFQLEGGSVKTSYIATAGSPLARSADTLSYSGAWTADNETRAVENDTDVDVDDWDGVVDSTLDSDADGILKLSSITVYTTGERPA